MSALPFLEGAPLELAAGEVRALRAAGLDARRAETCLLELAGEMVRGEARGWRAGAGTVQAEDLEQVGLLAVLRAPDTFTGAVPFHLHARRLVRAAMRQLVGSQGRDVAPSEHVRRGRRGVRTWAVDVVSREGSEPIRLFLEQLTAGCFIGELEVALDAERLSRALHLLEEQHRAALEQVFGLKGCEAVSIREYARARGMSRRRAEVLVREALEDLREELGG